jgi:iron(III) transport system permease protein
VLIVLVVALVLAVLVAAPLFFLGYSSFVESLGVGTDELTLQHYVEVFVSPYTYSTFVTSFVFAIGSGFLSLVLGVGLAWAIERTNVPFSSVFFAVVLTPLILPGILESIAWIFLLSPAFGYINVALMTVFGLDSAPINVFSLPGMIWVQSISNVPLVVLLMVAAFRSMDPTLEESARMSGASAQHLVRRVTLPLVLPAIASVLLLVIVRNFEAVEVPALIGLPARVFVYTSEIFLAFGDTPPNYGLGSALAVVLFVLTIGGLGLYFQATRRAERFQTVTGKAFRPRRMDLGKARWIAFALLAIYFVVAVAAPLAVIGWASLLPFFGAPSGEMLKQVSFTNYLQLADMPQLRSSGLNSLILAIGAATTTIALAAIVAWVVHRSRVPGAKLLEYLAFLPIAVPGIVLGMALISQYIALPIPIYGTLWLILIAYVTKYLPYGMRSTSGAMLQIHRELEEAAATSGAGPLVAFRRIVLPLLMPGMVAGWIYVVIVSFREFSTSVLLAGPDSRVLSVSLFYMFEQGQSTLVAAAGVLMIVTLMIVVGVFYKISGRYGVPT